jgi:hypothetical protein
MFQKKHPGRTKLPEHLERGGIIELAEVIEGCKRSEKK